jgi:hypothetical protein
MIRLQLSQPNNVDDARTMLQAAIGIEFGTLPPYLYALYSIRAATNAGAVQRIRSIVLQEMVHMCLGCNILNALGGDPVLTPPSYPGPLPGGIGPDGTPLIMHVFPFSKEAMEQATAIEQPEDPPDFPVHQLLLEAAVGPKTVTIGQYYAALDAFLSTLPASAWTQNRRQIGDDQFFAGQLYPIGSYADAHKAIGQIVSEGEGTKKDPLDFQDEPAHYYRFEEILRDKVLTKDANPLGYAWGPETLGVDWSAVYPGIADPASHDFSNEPAAAKSAQQACDAAYTTLVQELAQAVTGVSGALGQAVRAMFALRAAAFQAFTTPLADAARVAGPAFRFKP